MKFHGLVAAFFAAMICMSFSAHAVIISVVPNLSSVEQGNLVTVDITVSDLGDGIAPSVSIFDLDFSYDASVLGFSNAAFGNQLDLFGFGSLQLVDSSIAGTINLFELSFDFPSDLDTLQAPSFVLANLTFDALAVGTTNLSVTSNSFGDSLGDELLHNITNSSLEVTSPVPSPAPIWLVLTGVVGLVFARKKVAVVTPTL